MSQTIKNLTALEQLAVGYIKTSKEARNEVDPGEKQEVDFIVRIKGHLTIQPDVKNKAPTHKIPWTVVVAELLNRIGGENRDKTIAMLTSSIRDAFEKNTSSREAMLEDWPELKNPTEALSGLIKEVFEPTLQKGGVLPHLDVSLVEQPTNEETIPQPDPIKKQLKQKEII